MWNTIDSNQIFDALIFDCAYELYWFDKTVGYSLHPSLGILNDANAPGGYYVIVTSMDFTFAVSPDYQDPTDSSKVTSDVSRITKAAKVIQEVVQANQHKSDLKKLESYKEYICLAVSYNHAAAEYYENGYGDPWQLIYVFDEDSTTNVVCEGYSKAFQRLCELSSFEDSGFESRIMSGVMNGGTGSGPHMWNVVCLNGVNYLVDVTNSDADTIGQAGELFMSNSPVSGDADGYTFKAGGANISFAYDSSTKSMYSAAKRTLHAHAYTQQVESDEYLRQAATCTTPATYYLSCTCGEKGTGTFQSSVVPGHTYTDAYEAVEGGHKQKCDVCGELSAAVSAHSGGTATCTEQAKCEACKTPYGELADHAYTVAQQDETHHWNKCAHCDATDTPVAHFGGTATCTEQAKCVVCGTAYGELKGHVYDKQVAEEKYLASAATCTAKAKYYLSCVCGEKGTETFETGELLPHNYASNTYIPNGTGHSRKCDVCGTPDPAIADHTYEANSDICTVCKYEKDHVHAPQFAAGTPATCTAPGKKDSYTCYCGKMFLDKECTEEVTAADLVIDQLQHTYNQEKTEDKYLASAATCTAKAKYYLSCVCGEKGTETFETGELLPHNYASNTYIPNGTGHSRKCDVCGTPDPAIADHTYEANSDVCTVCKYEKDHVHAPQFAAGTPATCTAPGQKDSYTCYCGKMFLDEACTEEVTAADLVIDQLQHTYNQEKSEDKYLASAATCTAKAKYYLSCVCGEKGTETFEVGELADHVYDQMIAEAKFLDKAATCTAQATYFKSCVCGEKGTETFASGDFAKHAFTVPQNDEYHHWNKCANCDATEEKAAHTYGGGKVCDVCGYTLPDTHTHGKATAVAEVPASCQAPGVKAHYLCSCGLLFWDADCQYEVAQESDLVIKQEEHRYTVQQNDAYQHWTKCENCPAATAKKTHEYGDGLICGVCGYAKGAPLLPPAYRITAGAGQTVNVGEKAEFSSNADFGKFVKVQVDGKDLPSMHYTVRSGSTIVTLKPDYMRTLAVGRHMLTVVSQDGFAATHFQVEEPKPGETLPELPETGDPSHLLLWAMLMMASAAALCWQRKRRA